MQQTIEVSGAAVYIDFVLYIVENRIKHPLVYSVFDRSEMIVRSFLSNVSAGTPKLKTDTTEEKLALMQEPLNYVGRLERGMEKICHGLAVSGEIGKRFIITKKKDVHKDLYSYLMNNFQLPLLKEWIPYFLDAGKENLKIEEPQVLGDDAGRFQETCIVVSSITEELLEQMVSNGLKSGAIRIGKGPQKKLEFQGLDEYFTKYGHTIVNNLRQKLNPLSPLKERVETAALLHKRLYPQQSAVTNGLIELLDSSSYGIMNCGCGTGKTIMGCTAVEAWFYKKYLRKYKDKTLKDAYLDSKAVKYRNIVMCPSHLVEKWKREIEEEIPYVRVIVVHGLKELGKLQRKGRERTGKEFYILSKDTGKLSYSLYPQPYQMKRKKITVYQCSNCRKYAPFAPSELCSCGHGEWQNTGIEYYEMGLICPECGEMLYPLKKKLLLRDEMDERTLPLMPEDFANMTDTNKECRWCHAKLWVPACEPARTIFCNKKTGEPKWIRISHYANKARRNMKSVWVLKKELNLYLRLHKLQENEIRYCNIYGPRRFAPATYIKKKLKGYFDVAIFDELHELKGGGTAQGIAMHALVKASRKQIGLTGTIAGGYANHIFYLLFRLDPELMLSKGFQYGYAGEMKFSEMYGTVETTYEYNDSNGVYNVSSRGRMVAAPRCRPGISPLIFSEFLMKKAVFLDLSDMSRYLPDYKEEVRFIPLEHEIQMEYSRVQKILKELMKSGEGKTILSAYLQFALSYTDKPYSRRSIVSPLTGFILAEPGSFYTVVEQGKLLLKEQYLVELVNSELGENRNLFIFCEYTGEADSNVTHRLQQIIEQNCVLARGKTVILESRSPQAQAREEWMHRKAEEGARVFITNPKCVETGIDFIFYANGIKYNYPTLIFYQLGYNLFTIWQASRRAFRLIQTEECRTYYLASRGTIQTEVIKMIGEKQAATAAIQGAGFSAEGLSAMASGVDPRIRLANVLAEECCDTEDSIQSMFDVLRSQVDNSGEDEAYTPMLTFYELTGIVPETLEEYGTITAVPLFRKTEEFQEDLLEFVFGGLQDKPEIQGGEEQPLDIIDVAESGYRELEENKSVVAGAGEKDFVETKEKTDSSTTEKSDESMLEETLLEMLDWETLTCTAGRNRKAETEKKKTENIQINILEMFSA